MIFHSTIFYAVFLFRFYSSINNFDYIKILTLAFVVAILGAGI